MLKNQLYPLKFSPIIKEKIWGGDKLKSKLNKPTSGLVKPGESWEISSVEGDISVVANGPLKDTTLVELIENYKGELVGQKVYNKFGTNFPLLIKFIDANADLSIQVHPDDKLAQKRHNSFGKTEMWYVVDADEDATLITGFNQALDKKKFQEIFNDGRINEVLNKETANKDDVFFIPAGRIHTIGKGILIAEIQQTSDITYRIYDFDRVDSHGNKRELHVKDALDAIDYSHQANYRTEYSKDAEVVEIIQNQYFATHRIATKNKTVRDYKDIDSCIILMCIEGDGHIETSNSKINYTLGETILIPNLYNSVIIQPNIKSKFLEVFIPS